MSRTARPIELLPRQRRVLERIGRRSSGAHRAVMRARIILLADARLDNLSIAQQVGVDDHCVSKWRSRWSSQAERLASAEAQSSDQELMALIEQTLDDASRSGTPAKFSAEQVTQILAVACEPPEQSGRPVTHWTESQLAAEAVQRGIVPSISPRQAGRFLKDGRSQTPSKPLLAQRRARRSSGVYPTSAAGV